MTVPIGELSAGYCQDWAIVFSMMMDSVGIPSRLICGHVDRETHIWVTLPSLRLWCDGTADQFFVPESPTCACMPPVIIGSRAEFPHHAFSSVISELGTTTSDHLALLRARFSRWKGRNRQKLNTWRAVDFDLA